MNQSEFMQSKIVSTGILPGGKGSGRKSEPLRMRRLLIEETEFCQLCSKPAHGIYKKESGNKVLRCLDCAPQYKIVTGFKPVNMHIKEKENENFRY